MVDRRLASTLSAPTDMEPSTAGDGLNELVRRAFHLLQMEAPGDPESEPYRSQYAARALLEAARGRLEAELQQNDDCERRTLAAAQLACVLLQLGLIAVETDELTEGERQLELCRASAPQLEPRTVLTQLLALNQLGLVWSRRQESNKSQDYLQTAELLYTQYKQQVGLPPVLLADLFRGEEDGHEVAEKADTGKEEVSGADKLEETHTMTLYYLAQAYMNNNELVKAALYCHNTLSRQLSSSNYDPLEWALNSATLAQFYLPRHMFSNARHHLAAAEHVLALHRKQMDAVVDVTSEEHQAKEELYGHRLAEVGRCWAKLAQTILQASVDRLVTSSPAPPTCGTTEGLYFKQLDLKRLELQITSVYVNTFDDARDVFLCGQKWLNRARQHYTLDDHASDHVQVVREHSQLFKVLVFFESDLERQCRMFKRRADLLRPVAARLNPTYYLLVVRQLHYELAEIYSDMAQCKVDIQRERDKRQQHVTVRVVDKINALARQSIGYFDQFLDSVRTGPDGSLPSVLEDDLTRPVLIAYFHLGHLYNRLMEVELQPKLANLQKSLAAYQFIVSYCDRVPMGADKMKDELPACRELERLLPVKLLKVRNAINSGCTMATEVRY